MLEFLVERIVVAYPPCRVGAVAVAKSRPKWSMERLLLTAAAICAEYLASAFHCGIGRPAVYATLRDHPREERVGTALAFGTDSERAR